MSVRRNLPFGLGNFRMPRNAIGRRVDSVAKLLHIDKLLGRRPGQLSGGQRQLVAIGRAIVRKSIIFLFDESHSHLDAELRLQMRVEISSLDAELGNKMIYVTHDQIEAMTVADGSVVLRDGNVEQIGKPLDFRNHPANKFVAGFIDAPQMNFLSGTLGDSVLNFDSGMTRSASHSAAGSHKITFGIRQEEIEVSLEGDGNGQVEVRTFEQLGSLSNIYAGIPNGDTLSVQLDRQIPLQRGQITGFSYDTNIFHKFGEDGRVLEQANG